MTVTGTANFLAVKQPFVSDPCKEIAESPVLLSIPPVVTAYLEEANATAADIQLVELAERCVTRLERLFLGDPVLAGRCVGKTVFTVVVASYDPQEKLSIIRSFNVDLPAPTRIAANLDVDARYGLLNQPDLRAFGQGSYLVEHVLNGVGRKFVEAKYDVFLEKKAVSDIESGFAADIAVNLIEATAKTSELVPIPAGVGGPIDVFLVGPNGGIQRLR